MIPVLLRNIARRAREDFRAGRRWLLMMLSLPLPLLLLLGGAAPLLGAAPQQRDAGILYEIWHTGAAHLMQRVAASGATQPVTVETVIRSDGAHTLDGVFEGPTPEVPPGFTPDIYNVQPQLGFYCLYRPRPGENVTADTLSCPNITGVAKQHALWLTTAGFDYVAVDITNWPLTGPIGKSTTAFSTDVQILRPLEVLAEEWLALRSQVRKNAFFRAIFILKMII
jgi:hypothetical protein